MENLDCFNKNVEFGRKCGWHPVSSNAPQPSSQVPQASSSPAGIGVAASHAQSLADTTTIGKRVKELVGEYMATINIIDIEDLEEVLRKRVELLAQAIDELSSSALVSYDRDDTSRTGALAIKDLLCLSYHES